MSASISALLAFVALTLALVAIYVGYRVALVFSFKAPANSWTRGAETRPDPAIITRITHAHLNCLENLPLFAAVILAAALTDQLATTDGLAWWFIAARIAQSAVHVAAVNHWMVFLRANLLVVQWAILIYWILSLTKLV